MLSLYGSIKRESAAFGYDPVGIWCHNDVIWTSMRRHHVASTLTRRHFTSCARREVFFLLRQLFALKTCSTYFQWKINNFPVERGLNMRNINWSCLKMGQHYCKLYIFLQEKKLICHLHIANLPKRTENRAYYMHVL